MKARVIAACIVLLLALGATQALAVAPIVGAPCLTAGLKSGSLICLKVSGQLKWQKAKKMQLISYSSPREASIAERTVKLSYSATSKLAVSITSLSPTICTVGIKLLRSTGTPGICNFVLSQPGSINFLPAKRMTIQVKFFGTNVINFSLPETISMSQGSLSLAATSTSELPITFISNTEDVCSISNFTLTLNGAGTCTVEASQIGSIFIPPAVTAVRSMKVLTVASTIEFTLPPALLLSQRTYSLTAKSSANIALTFSSLTPEICSVIGTTLSLLKPGTCQVTVNQAGTKVYAANSVSRSVDISVARVRSDLPDQISGFQLKAIYVVPSDGVDNSYDTNGRIAAYLNEGTGFLQSELGLTIPIDSTTPGYDITFLKSSKPASYFAGNSDADYELMQEAKFLDSPSPNRKEFVFFVDVPTVQGTNICGFARLHTVIAVVAAGAGLCTQRTSTFESFASNTWIHEVFHNFGVNHVPDPCDLMASGDPADGPLCSFATKVTIDRGNKFYVKSSNYGQNIAQLRVWNGFTADQSLKAECWEGSRVPRSDGVLYAYCPTGTRTIGALTLCWNNINSISLEELSNGIWNPLGAGSSTSSFWGGELPGLKCNDPNFGNPWKVVTVNDAGISHYRWIINGTVVQEMNVIWVK